MSKFGNKKCSMDGFTFDSYMERNYYMKLKHDKLVGDVLDFSLQPSFEVLESYMLNGKKKRGVSYVADFLITYRDGKQVIIDVKGAETKEFVIKRKMYESKFGEKLPLLVIREVDGKWINVDDIKKTTKKDGKLNVRGVTNKRKVQRATRNSRRVR